LKDLTPPAAADMRLGQCWGKKAKKTIQTMPSSNNTVSQHISDMAGDVLYRGALLLVVYPAA
jgi:hypothetical protein